MSAVTAKVFQVFLIALIGFLLMGCTNPLTGQSDERPETTNAESDTGADSDSTNLGSEGTRIDTAEPRKLLELQPTPNEFKTEIDRQLFEASRTSKTIEHPQFFIVQPIGWIEETERKKIEDREKYESGTYFDSPWVDFSPLRYETNGAGEAQVYTGKANVAAHALFPADEQSDKMSPKEIAHEFLSGNPKLLKVMINNQPDAYSPLLLTQDIKAASEKARKIDDISAYEIKVEEGGVLFQLVVAKGGTGSPIYIILLRDSKYDDEGNPALDFEMIIQSIRFKVK